MLLDLKAMFDLRRSFGYRCPPFPPATSIRLRRGFVVTKLLSCSPSVEVVHDDGSDQCLAEAGRKRNKGVVKKRLRHDLQLVLPNGVVHRVDPRPRGFGVYRRSRQRSRGGLLLLLLLPWMLLVHSSSVVIRARIKAFRPGTLDLVSKQVVIARACTGLVDVHSAVARVVATTARAWSFFAVARRRRRRHCRRWPLSQAADTTVRSALLVLLLLVVLSLAAVMITKATTTATTSALAAAGAGAGATAVIIASAVASIVVVNIAAAVAAAARWHEALERIPSAEFAATATAATPVALPARRRATSAGG